MECASLCRACIYRASLPCRSGPDCLMQCSLRVANLSLSRTRTQSDSLAEESAPRGAEHFQACSPSLRTAWSRAPCMQGCFLSLNASTEYILLLCTPPAEHFDAYSVALRIALATCFPNHAQTFRLALKGTGRAKKKGTICSSMARGHMQALSGKKVKSRYKAK